MRKPAPPPSGALARKWNASISFRFLCIVSAILLVCSFASTGIICLNQDRMVEHFLINKAQNLGSYVAKLSKEPLLANNVVQLDAIVREAIKDDDIVYAFVRNAQGEVITSHFASIDYIWMHKSGIVLPLPRDASILQTVAALKEKDDLQQVSVPIEIEGERLGEVTVGISEHRTDAQLLNTALFVLSLNIAAAFLVGAAIYAVSRSMILAPIRALARATETLAAGGIDTRVEVEATGEVRLLVEAFNRFSHDLRETTVSKEYLDNIIGSMNDTLIVVSPEGQVLLMNRAACRLLGYGEDELVGQPVETIFGEEAQRKNTLLRELHKKGNLQSTERTYRSKDGRNIPVLFSASEISTGAALAGYVLVANDIGERKRAERKLLQTQAELVKNHEVLSNLYAQQHLHAEQLGKAYADLKVTQAQMIQNEKLASIGQLAAGVAHEINNPIAFINSNLGTLDKYLGRILSYLETQNNALARRQDGAMEAELAAVRKQLKIDYILEDVGRVIGESQEGVERVKTIVNGLKMFSRKDEEEQTEADINAGLENTINVIWNELKYKVTLHKELEEIPMIRCYPGQLNQVFMNLLVNSSHAIEKQGEITVRTGVEEGNIVVSISDTGCGIPEAILQKIFEPFFTTKEVGKGTGLGLSISYDIVKKHGGEITVESAPGEGTTFRIILPIG